jgi:Na+-translocating membrane potential-generating system (MpsC)
MTDARSSAASEAPGKRASRSNDQLSQVCGAFARGFRRAWGRGPVRTTAHWVGPNTLLVLLEDGHTEAEKTMRAAGRIQELLGGRRLLQMLIEDDLRASVEQILDRSVETTLSATRIDPDLSAEIFLLKPTETEGDAVAAAGSVKNTD